MEYQVWKSKHFKTGLINRTTYLQLYSHLHLDWGTSLPSDTRPEEDTYQVCSKSLKACFASLINNGPKHLQKIFNNRTENLMILSKPVPHKSRMADRNPNQNHPGLCPFHSSNHRHGAGDHKTQHCILLCNLNPIPERNLWKNIPSFGSWYGKFRNIYSKTTQI